MPKIRVTMPVTLLVDADLPKMADIFAGMWSVSMKQATHGVKLQPIPKEILAVSFEPHKCEVEDVSEEFGRYVQRFDEEAGSASLNWTKAFGNFNVGMQPYWDLYTTEKANPELSRPSTRVRYLCTHCGAWREANSGTLFAALSEGQGTGTEEESAALDARKKEMPFMQRHLRECGPKGGTVRGIHPEDPEWNDLSPDKRES